MSKRERSEDPPVPQSEEATENHNPKSNNIPSSICSKIVPVGTGVNSKHFALLLSYIGTGFRGLQFQPDFDDTIDGTILASLHAAGLIHERSHKGCYYRRSCRTDKGVHALRNVVTLRLHNDVFDASSETSALARMNAAMSEGHEGSRVKAIGLIHIMDSFRAREWCTKRKYQYVLPLYAIDPNADEASEYAHTPERATDLVKAFNLICQRFVGVRRYHNFTGDGLSLDPNSSEAIRNVYECGIREGFFFEMPTDNNNVYVVFRIEAQSFLLNMIRKILGVTLAISRGVRPGLLDAAMDPTQDVDTPMAPGSNLYLETPYFDTYDADCSKIRSPRYPKLCDSWQRADESLNEFEQKIWREVGSIERETQSMTKFVRMLRVHNWCVRKHKNAKKK